MNYIIYSIDSWSKYSMEGKSSWSCLTGTVSVISRDLSIRSLIYNETFSTFDWDMTEFSLIIYHNFFQTILKGRFYKEIIKCRLFSGVYQRNWSRGGVGAQGGWDSIAPPPVYASVYFTCLNLIWTEKLCNMLRL